MANVVPTFAKQIWSGRLIGTSPTQAEPLNLGFGQGNATAGTDVTALTSDKGLGAEIVANGGQSTRVAGTSSQQTTTSTNDTYRVVGTITCNVSSLKITEAGLFDTSAFPGQTTIATVGVLSGTGTGTTTLTSGTGLPTASTDYQIDQEVLTGTLSGTTLTISARGANGSTAAAHSAGAIITVAAPSGTGAGGKMAAKADFAVISLASGDTLQLTANVQFS